MAISPPDTDPLARPFVSQVAGAEYRIVTAIAQAIRADSGTPDWGYRALMRMPSIRMAVNSVMMDLAQGVTLDDAYRKAALSGSGRAERALAGTTVRAAEPRLVGHRHATVVAPPRAQQLMVREMLPNVLRSTNDVYRQVVSQALLTPVHSEAERLRVAQQALDQFAARGVTGFVDRAGRRWNMTSYVEMATRTALSRAAIDSYVDRCVEAGFDVVQVSQHARCSPQCAPFQGRLLSLRGFTVGVTAGGQSGEGHRVIATLKEARARGFEHPGCRHHLSLLVPGNTPDRLAPIDPQAYRDEQQLRTLERAVRGAKLDEARALTPEVSQQARSRVRMQQKAIREHLDGVDLQRNRRREQVGMSR